MRNGWRVEAHEVGYDGIGSGHHQQYTGKPGAEGNEETPIPTKRLMRPVIERTFVLEHYTKLSRSDSTWYKKSDCAENPVGKSSGPPCDGGRGICNEKDDHYIDNRHIE